MMIIGLCCFDLLDCVKVMTRIVYLSTEGSENNLLQLLQGLPISSVKQLEESTHQGCSLL